MPEKQVKSRTKRKPNKTAWKPGQSGNPKGRTPNTKMIPAILRDISAEINGLDPEKKQTILEGICAKAILQALEGDKPARDWVSDRMEGKAQEHIHSYEHDAEEVKVIE